MNSSSVSRRNFRDSVAEVRYFCQHGGPTIDGSIPISEQPKLTKEQQGNMFAIKSKQGMYLVNDDKDWCNSWDIDRIKWYSHYLEAEEKSSRMGYASIGCLQVMREALAVKDVTIRQLRDEVSRMSVTHPMHQEFWKQSSDKDSTSVANPEHADESQNNS
jgi:hypothetical protein